MERAKSGARGGRPAYKPTTTDRRRVEEMLSCGISEDEIATTFGCSRTTLRKHFGPALFRGRAKRRAEANQLLWRQARAGKGWAIKEVCRLTALASAEASMMADDSDQAAAGPKLGKKEIAQRAAELAATGEASEWGDDLRVPSATSH